MTHPALRFRAVPAAVRFPHGACTFLLFLISFCCKAIDVPAQLDFAGMRLRIQDDVRGKIQADVDRLAKPGKHADAKLERIRLYFPIIERILAEEGLPPDFKYLVVQESDLISDAVSTSNAVGFWQFKRETALEMGLSVNNEVDERKHIVASTRAAARYLKRNNFFFNNWLHALTAYNTGVTGAKPFFNEGDRGAARMEIDNDTHWYVLKFLAHRIAFANAVLAGPYASSASLLEYPATGGQRLADIAAALRVSEEDLVLYNKWLAGRRIPDDKPYTVLVPVPADQAAAVAVRANVPPKPPVQFNYEYSYDVEADSRKSGKYPELKKRDGDFYAINGRPGIRAATGEDAAALARRGGVPPAKFLVYNDLSATDALRPGQVYYLKRKRNKGRIHYHTYQQGETLWQIAQKYGMRLKALRVKNRLAEGDSLQNGRVLWLRFRRPANKEIEIRNVPKPTPKPDPVLVRKGGGLPAETIVKPPAVTDAAGRLPAPAREVPVPVRRDTVRAAAIPTPAPVPAQPPSAGTPSADTVAPAGSPPAASPRPASPAPAAEELVLLQSHEVRMGETLYGISRQYGVTVAQLRQWNDLAETDGLRLGQKLIVGEETKPASVLPPPVPPSVPVRNPQPVAAEHTVQAGETLYSIARRYGITLADLRGWNNLAETDGVRPGQRLRLAPAPGSAAPADSTRTVPAAAPTEHTVQAGETLYQIAKRYGVSVAQLLEWNGKATPSVAVGEKVRVRK